MPTRRFSGITVAASEPDNGGDNSGGGGSGGTYVDDVFSTYLYTGTNTVQSINNGVDLAEHGGLVWIKARTNAPTIKDHQLTDDTSGYSKIMESNNSKAAFIFGTPGAGILTATATGFDTTNASRINASGGDYVSWTFRKAKKFFDAVTYTGDSNDLTLSHNLGVEPGIIIIKNVSESNRDWYVYHKSLGHTKSLTLNSDSKEAGSSAMVSPPTDKTFTLKGGQGATCTDPYEYVAYLFAHDDSDESIIKCGSYTGNGNAVGPTIDLGFEPQWVMIKSSSNTSNWIMLDNMRGVVADGLDDDLYANLTYATPPSVDFLEFTSTGFIPKNNTGDTNSLNQDYIYMAIRRPNKPAEKFEPEELFAVNSLRQEPDPGWIAGFPTDFSLHNTVNEAGSTQAQSRLTGTSRLFTDQTTSEGPISANLWDYMDGNRQGNGVANSKEFQWMWRRAPGFFDVVTYEGNGGWTTVNHSLAVEPEMIISKSRSVSDNWWVWVPSTGSGQMFLNTDGALPQVNNYMRKATNESFEILPSHTENIAYLFASVPGISKLGSYTGRRGDQDIDCGFTNGASFVLIKRTDAAGDWWFTIDPSNPSMLSKLNDTIPASNQGNSIYQYASGFGVSQSGGADLSVDGAEYIYYAIA
jgi:hypothetical protein